MPVHIAVYAIAPLDDITSNIPNKATFAPIERSFGPNFNQRFSLRVIIAVWIARCPLSVYGTLKKVSS